MPILRCALALSLLAFWSVSAASDGYYRYPAIHGDTVVFTAEGDLWSVPASGGSARRLTTHASEESRAAISHDGRWIAFSANYEGAQEVYVMPITGGQPKRISFENSQAWVQGWTPDGDVLATVRSESGMTWATMVVAIDSEALERKPFPLADANDAVVDADGRWLYFIRFGLAITNDNARGYRGGALGQLWRYDLHGRGEAERIGPRDANVRRPMWRDGRLLVVSDADGRYNLWSLADDGSDSRQLTRHRDFDVRSAQTQGDRIVYQLGADLRVYDLASNQDRVLDIQLVSDFDQRRERWLDEPLRYLESTSFAPAGDRVVVNARGRAILAGLGNLRRIEIAAPAGSRLSSPVISPDGRFVYAISDTAGEQEIWRFPADGSEGGKAFTRDGESRRWHLWLSPDGKHLAHDDKRGRLWLLDTTTGNNRRIDDGSAVGSEGYDSVAWSADSRHLVFVRQARNVERTSLALYSLDDNRVEWLTDDRYASYSPTFSADGRWLWFLSDREFRVVNRAPWGDRNLGPFFDKRTKIYAFALQPDSRFPFLPDDELSLYDAPTSDSEKQSGKTDDDRKVVPVIVRAGLVERLYEAPLPAGNYRNLQVGKDRLYFLDGNDPNAATLKYAGIGNRDEQPVQVEGRVAEYGLSGDGSKLYLRTPGDGDKDFGQLYIAETATALPDSKSKITIKLDDWSMQMDPPTEWRQMFADAWRLHRDHFYDDRLRGIDWTATRQRYEPLLQRVTDRAELSDLLAQMMGELGALHSQVRGGDARRAEDGAETAGLGATFERAEGGWRIVGILRGSPELPSERSPLQAPGVDIRVGDIVVAVNGRRADSVRNLFDLLRNQAGKQVLLELRRGTAAHKAVVVAIDTQREDRLRYTDWVESARARVEQSGHGRIGYLHLYAMGPNDIANFAREFYAQYDRDGLIIDVRRNRGGNIDSWVIEKLLRRAWAFWQRPNGQPYANMQQAFRGHLVVLTDALTYSDGETFSAGVKALELGPLIGTRTAGAGVWLSDRNLLVDGGAVRAAESPQYGMDGEWLIEGAGVEPDIVVENLPHATFEGHDAQLEAGIAWLKRKLDAEPIAPLRPRPIPPLPAQ